MHLALVQIDTFFLACLLFLFYFFYLCTLYSFCLSFFLLLSFFKNTKILFVQTLRRLRLSTFCNKMLLLLFVCLCVSVCQNPDKKTHKGEKYNIYSVGNRYQSLGEERIGKRGGGERDMVVKAIPHCIVCIVGAQRHAWVVGASGRREANR